MKGISYLVNDEGEKTHVVLDLALWQSAWQAFVAQQTSAQAQPRQFGAMRREFEAAGFDVERVGDALLEPMTEEELSELFGD